jgi:hypothetical protein
MREEGAAAIILGRLDGTASIVPAKCCVAELITAPEMRRTYQVEYSIGMISDIGKRYNDVADRGDDLCARSMIDAFYVHIWLLTDFLVKLTKKGQDFGPADFC